MKFAHSNELYPLQDSLATACSSAARSGRPLVLAAGAGVAPRLQARAPVASLGCRAAWKKPGAGAAAGGRATMPPRAPRTAGGGAPLLPLATSAAAIFPLPFQFFLSLLLLSMLNGISYVAAA